MRASFAPMKILYSHRTKSADGQYVHIRALTDALAARGHDVVMAGPDDRHGAPRPLDARAGEGGMRTLFRGPLRELAEFAYSAPAYARLAAAARRCAPDILYERYNLFHHAGARLARARALPFLLEVNAPLAEERAAHGGLALPAFARWSEGGIWRAADALLPVTAALARHAEAAGVAPEKIHVIQNGVDEAFLAPADPAPIRAAHGLDGKIVLGFAGFVRDWHGVDRAVRYLAARPRDDLRLFIVGDGAARAALEAEAAALGVAEKVVFAGVVQRAAMPAHVAAFDIALQPAATAYASPLKLFDYMAQSRAIAAPAQANILETLTDGVDAALFPPDDERGFFAALDALVADAALRARLGAGARATLVRRDLTWAANAERVEKIAAALLERKT